MDTTLREIERRANAGDDEAVLLLKHRERADGYDTDSITIDGETFEPDDVREGGEGVAWITVGRREFYVALDSETAGHEARRRWAEMAEDDPLEFEMMVGAATLVQWALGRSAGPGTSKVRSLSEWLDLWVDTPAEQFASYDGEERTIERVGFELAERLGFIPTVAYRQN